MKISRSPLGGMDWQCGEGQGQHNSLKALQVFMGAAASSGIDTVDKKGKLWKPLPPSYPSQR